MQEFRVALRFVKRIHYLTEIRTMRHFTICRCLNLSWYMGISWMPLPRMASVTIKLFNIVQSGKAWKKFSPSWPMPKVKLSRFLNKEEFIVNHDINEWIDIQISNMIGLCLNEERDCIASVWTAGEPFMFTCVAFGYRLHISSTAEAQDQ